MGYGTLRTKSQPLRIPDRDFWGCLSDCRSWGSSSLCVVNRVLAPSLLSAGMQTKSNCSPGPGVKILGITLQDKEHWVVCAVANPIGICPDCGTRSRYRHGWHNRRLQGLPVQGQVVNIKRALSRWQCKHRQCRRRTERMAEIVGIDDWSWRHSSRYGTVMVGLERHSVVDVLDERSLYAQAVREGAPQARQKDGHRIARHLL